MRDRTYKNVEDGDYLSERHYLFATIFLLLTHITFEFMYIYLEVTPMIFINIASILAYVISVIYILRGNTLITLWIIVLEIYIHVVFASIFMGLACGVQLWLYGTLSSIFLPFFSPDLAENPKRQIGVFSGVIILTFLGLTALDRLGVLPTTYNVEKEIADVLYYINAFLGFGAIMLYTAIFNKTTTSRRRELQVLADHDYLTGIYNRQRIQKILDAEILREQELGENRLAVAIADIDFFKKINDTYGHVTGDDALKELAKIFSQYEEKGLLYGRWGGEEFLLIAPENLTYKEFADMLEGIRKQVEAHEFESMGKMIRFTISIGAAYYEQGMTVEQFVDSADDRLYNAKGTGRNKIVY